MTSSRLSIRQQMAQSIPHSVVGTATASSSTTELFDQDDELMAFEGDGGPDRTGYWILRSDAAVVAGDRIRRVAKHDRGLGMVRPSRPWTTGPSAGEVYELYPPDWRPALIDNAINKGLKRLTYLVEETITAVNNTNQYTLNFPWLTNERQVMEVYWQYTNANTIYKEEWAYWKVFVDEGVFKLYVDPIPSTATGNTIVLEGRAHYTTLADDVTTTPCPSDWAVAAAMVECYRELRKANQGQDVSRFTLELEEAKKELFRQTKIYINRRGRRIMPRTPSRAPNNRVRRGEFYY